MTSSIGYSYIQGDTKISHYQMIKNRIKLYLSPSKRLHLFVKLKYESNIIIVFVGIRNSIVLCDLFYDLRPNNSARPANWRYALDRGLR